MDCSELMVDAGCRKIFEETGVKIELMRRYQKDSDPPRDFRQHNISTVFIAKAIGTPKAGSDVPNKRRF